tara:strand:+ start:1006 stop:1383 length:378 start_codon:yes stop_codon:yes gene_type:complete
MLLQLTNQEKFNLTGGCKSPFTMEKNMYFNNLTENETTILDQAFGHYCVKVDQFPDLIAHHMTSFNSVKTIARLYAEINFDFETIYKSIDRLIEIDKELKARIDRETESFAGKFYYGQHDHLKIS